MASRLIKFRNIKQALSFGKTKPSDDIINCTISGRIRSFRRYRAINFIDLVDGSTYEHLQVIVSRSKLAKPDLGSYVNLQGYLASSSGPQQDVELKVEQVLYSSECDPDRYPLLVDEQTTPNGWYRRYPHLRPRISHFASLLRVRSELELSLQMIFKQMDFFKVQTPIFTSNDSESTSDLFLVNRRCLKSNEALAHDSDNESSDDESIVESETTSITDCKSPDNGFFGKEVYLSTSAQLHLESLAAALGRVYCISSAFRAENSVGPRHLCEFTMLEAEEANVEQIEQLMDRVEVVIKFVLQYLSEISEHQKDLTSLLDRNSHHDNFKKLAQAKYIRMSYKEAVDILQNCSKLEASHGSGIKFGKDINRTHEKILLQHCDNVPIFITNYPKQLKPFYMKSIGETAACFDLIAPLGGEICGGSLREDNLEVLKNSLDNMQINHLGEDESDTRDKFDWYLQLREFGSFPHGGFGLGIERLVKALVGIKNIRDASVFPRSPGHCPM